MCSWAPNQSLMNPGGCTGPAWTLQVAFHLQGVMGETSSPSCICLEHLISLESSCWHKDKLRYLLLPQGGVCPALIPILRQQDEQAGTLRYIHTSCRARADEGILINTQSCHFLAPSDAISAFKQLLWMHTEEPPLIGNEK